MRGRLLGAITFVLCAATSHADPETVHVESSAIDGIWRFDFPSDVRLDLMQSAHFGPMAKRYCRIESTSGQIAVRCIAPDFFRIEGTAEIQQNQVHLSLGSALARHVIDATLDDAFHMTGTYAVRVMGIRHDAPGPSAGEKIRPTDVPSQGADDLAFRQTLQGLMESTSTKFMPPIERQALGAIQAVIYLGQTTTVGAKTPQVFNVYQVEFSSGERLCGWHHRDETAMGGVVCV